MTRTIATAAGAAALALLPATAGADRALFRVDPRRGVTRAIDHGGASLVN